MKTALLGLMLTAVMSLVALVMWGSEAVVGAVTFGLLAAAIQVAAVEVLKRGWQRNFSDVLVRFGAGMGLRLLGIVALAVVVSMRPEVFQPLSSALGYVGVLIPLLYMELKLVK